MTLSLQSNAIVAVPLLSDGEVGLNNETIAVCSRNGHVLGYGDTKAEFADGSVVSKSDLLNSSMAQSDPSILLRALLSCLVVSS